MSLKKRSQVLNFLLSFTHSTPPSQPHHREPVIQNLPRGSLSCVSPLLSIHITLSQALHISLLVSLACLITSLPNSTSIFRKTDNNNVSFPLHTIISVPVIQGEVQTPHGVQALLGLIQAYRAFIFSPGFSLSPVFCSSTELIGHRIHYTLSFLLLNMYCSLLVHFVSWSNLYVLRAQKLHMCFDPAISFKEIL